MDTILKVSGLTVTYPQGFRREKIALKVQYLSHPGKYPDPEVEVSDAGTPADSGPEGGGGEGDASQPADSSAVAPERSGGGCGCATLAM